MLVGDAKVGDVEHKLEVMNAIAARATLSPSLSYLIDL
jgi:hypothetical protein